MAAARLGAGLLTPDQRRGAGGLRALCRRRDYRCVVRKRSPCGGSSARVVNRCRTALEALRTAPVHRAVGNADFVDIERASMGIHPAAGAVFGNRKSRAVCYQIRRLADGAAGTRLLRVRGRAQTMNAP